MYLRATPRKNNDGSVMRYLQLAHNMWDPAAKRSRVQVIYNFGREDLANRAALQRLVASVTRFLDPDKALAAAAEGLQFIESRPLGGTWVLDGLWHRLGIGATMRKLLTGRRLDERAERVLFGLVANARTTAETTGFAEPADPQVQFPVRRASRDRVHIGSSEHTDRDEPAHPAAAAR